MRAGVLCAEPMRGDHVQAQLAGGLGDLLAVRVVGFRTHQDDDQGDGWRRHSRPTLRRLASSRGSTG